MSTSNSEKQTQPKEGRVITFKYISNGHEIPISLAASDENAILMVYEGIVLENVSAQESPFDIWSGESPKEISLLGKALRNGIAEWKNRKDEPKVSNQQEPEKKTPRVEAFASDKDQPTRRFSPSTRRPNLSVPDNRISPQAAPAPTAPAEKKEYTRETPTEEDMSFDPEGDEIAAQAFAFKPATGGGSFRPS